MGSGEKNIVYSKPVCVLSGTRAVVHKDLLEKQRVDKPLLPSHYTPSPLNRTKIITVELRQRVAHTPASLMSEIEVGFVGWCAGDLIEWLVNSFSQGGCVTG